MSILDQPRRARLDRDGFLVLERFAPPEACDRLRARAAELVAAFEPGAQRSIFTTDEQVRHTDEHFLGSADEIRFFFEERALGPEGKLLVPKERALNKIGHALHDLDSEFDRFSRTPALRQLASDLGMDDALLVQS